MKGAIPVGEALFSRLEMYDHVTVSWVGDDGYPMQTPADFRVDAAAGVVRIDRTAVPVPTDREVNITVSHIRPQLGTGYDQRRYVVTWGRVAATADGYVMTPAKAWGWDENDVPFFEYSERANPQAHAYMKSLSIERDAEVRPRLSRFWTFLLATRLPFLTATFVPILLGIAVAARAGEFNWWLALLTLVGGACVHIGLNVANDIFDALSGADDANVSPTQYSGGSRVIQRGLVTLRGMSMISIAAYAVGIGIGLYLVVYRGSLELLGIGIAGVFLSVFYTAPPFRLVHRGLGELTTALGFGPIMVLGAYVVQTDELAWEPFIASIPVAILIALILYLNEIPDRPGDAKVGKRTLPVRLSPDVITSGFLVAALAAFATVVLGVAFDVLPVPTLLALLALPLVFQIYQGVREYYDKPYEIMGYLGKNVQLHLVTGLLLFAGYMIAVAADAIWDSPPGLLT